MRTWTARPVRVAAVALVALVAPAAVGCVDHAPAPSEGWVNSLEVRLVDPPPSALGSPEKPVQLKQATFDIVARDDQGQRVARDLSVEVFISFGGVKTGANSACGADVGGNVPIETLTLHGGALMGHTMQLPLAFGATSIWIDERQSGATGASPTIYFRNALIPEVQTPPDLTASNASFCSPFNGKFLIVDHATGAGQLVVSSVFGNAFAVTDTGAVDPAGKSGNFASIYLYAFGKPPAYIVEGRVLRSFSGNYSKFVGFTELNFPLFDADPAAPLVDPPAPVVLQLADIATTAKMLSAAAATVQYTGTICDPLQAADSWIKYNQFVLDNNGTCDAFSNMAVELPAKLLGTFDPLKNVGKTATVVGMLRNNSGQNPVLDANGNMVSCTAQSPCPKGTCISGQCYKNAFNFWTVLPRRQTDITVAQ